ncbi:MAG TPA: hypothetical protein VHZ96_01720 [Frankiaceae bacterium]|jgi:hypothetical protein|nr:hypothetical protein [Frankiaceae bacterium]
MKHEARVHLAKAKRVEHHEDGKYSASLADLEASAHVPLDEQITEQPEAPAQAPLTEGAVERNAMLRVTGGA